MNFGVLLLSNIQAYQARSIQSEFNESQYISIIMASMLQAFLIGIPIMALVGGKLPRVFYLVGVSLIFVVCMVILLLLFLPKMLFLSREREQEKKDGSSKNKNHPKPKSPNERNLPPPHDYYNSNGSIIMVQSETNFQQNDGQLLPLPSIPEENQQHQPPSSAPGTDGNSGSWLVLPSSVASAGCQSSTSSDHGGERFGGGSNGPLQNTKYAAGRIVVDVSELGASEEVVSITFRDEEDDFEENYYSNDGTGSKSHDDVPPVRPTRVESDCVTAVDRNDDTTTIMDDDGENCCESSCGRSRYDGEQEGGGSAVVAVYYSANDDDDNENNVGINVVPSFVENPKNNKMRKPVRPFSSFGSTNSTKIIRTTTSGTTTPSTTTTTPGGVPDPPHGGGDCSPTRPMRVESEKSF